MIFHVFLTAILHKRAHRQSREMKVCCLAYFLLMFFENGDNEVPSIECREFTAATTTSRGLKPYI